MEYWLRKKTGLRVKRVYRKYYRKHGRFHTWVDNGKALYHPGVQKRIRYKRYRHRPNPYLEAQNTPEIPYHLSPYPGKRKWQGYHVYGEKWTAIREEVLERDEQQCRVCGGFDRVEVHHHKKHKPNRSHKLDNLITLCSACHRELRNPESDIHRALYQMLA